MNERPTQAGQGEPPEPHYEPRPPAARLDQSAGERLRELGLSVPLVNRVLLISGAVAVLLGLLGMILGRVLSSMPTS